MFATLFPFEIRMRDENSSYIRFYFKPSPGFRWIFVNLLALAFAVLLILRRRWPLKSNITDLVITAVTGVYGLIATQFFPNKFGKFKPPIKK